MKKSPLLILFMALLLWNCQNTTPTEEDNTIVITGKIEGATAEKIPLYSNIENEEYDITDGQFTIELDRDQPNIVMLYYGKHRWNVYAEPGDSIHMDLSEENVEESLTFSKDNKKENEFLNELVNKMEIQGKDYKKYFTSTEADFVAMVDSLKGAAVITFGEFVANNEDVSEQFTNIAKDHLNYTAAQYYNQYPSYYKYYSKDEDYERGEALKKAQASIERERPDLLGLPAYGRFIESSLSTQVSELMKEDSSYQDMENGYLFAFEKVIDEEIESEKIAEFLKYNRLYSSMQYSDPNKLEALYTSFMESSDNDFYKNKLQTAYEEWAHLKPGLPAPDFRYPDIDSTMHALSDYKGKLVYIDVWATWCGPCLAEQPYLEKIEKEYEGNSDIVFMGVSIDEDKEAWEKMVSEKDMTGVQLIAYNAWQSDIAQDYNIGGIPRFLLIDQNGNIVSADAYRPSNEKLKEQLEKLLAPVKG